MTFVCSEELYLWKQGTRKCESELILLLFVKGTWSHDKRIIKCSFIHDFFFTSSVNQKCGKPISKGREDLLRLLVIWVCLSGRICGSYLKNEQRSRDYAGLDITGSLEDGGL